MVGFVAQSNKGQLRDNNIQPDYCIVIERYTRPNKQYPNGELSIVAGDTLLYYGDLPFVKQDALFVLGNFYGVSIIERDISIQRAYNAVKNRKHEFLNRLAV